MVTRFLALLALLVLPAVLPAGADGVVTTPGFSPNAPKGEAPAPLIGRWVNSFLHAEEDQPQRRFWQVIDLRQNGEMTHDYFSTDPALSAAIAYARIVSSWQAGNFLDPEAEKGCFEVIRFAPLAYSNYNARQGRYHTLRGNFAPQFRRFALSADHEELTLSRAVILEIPVDRVLSYPSGTASMLFSRYEPNGTNTAIEASSWGAIKEAALETAEPQNR